MIKFHNYLAAKELNEEMDKADLVISRSGYSTIMDVVQRQKKAVLIPTPGQPEQEYLAALLNQTQVALSIEQKNFSLPVILDKAKKFNYQLPTLDSMDQLPATISNFISKLKGWYPAYGHDDGLEKVLKPGSNTKAGRCTFINKPDLFSL